MDTLLSTVLLAAITQNLALDALLGLCPMLAVSRKHDVAAGMAVVTVVMLPLVCVAGYLVQAWFLRPLRAESLALVIWALMVATLALGAERWLHARRAHLYQRYGVFLPLLGANCLVLGAVLLTTAPAQSLAHVIAYSIGTAAGYAAVLLVLASLRERLAMTALPAAMRGAPAVVLTLAQLALGMLGLRGVG